MCIYMYIGTIVRARAPPPSRPPPRPPLAQTFEELLVAVHSATCAHMTGHAKKVSDAPQLAGQRFLRLAACDTSDAEARPTQAAVDSMCDNLFDKYDLGGVLVCGATRL